jgi:hypothetical protein
MLGRYTVREASPYGIGEAPAIPTTASSAGAWANVIGSAITGWFGYQQSQEQADAQAAYAQTQADIAASQAAAAQYQMQTAALTTKQKGNIWGIALGVGGVALLAAALLLKKKKGKK